MHWLVPVTAQPFPVHPIRRKEYFSGECTLCSVAPFDALAEPDAEKLDLACIHCGAHAWAFQFQGTGLLP